jgi:tetratricopeptide (TPR) repeat protein
VTLRQAQGKGGRSLLVLLLLLLSPLARAATPEFRGKDGQAAMAALGALAQEDADRARDLLAPYEPFARGSQGIRFAGGVLRFFEQRYDEAVQLMESSGAGSLGGYLPLARAAREITKDDVRFEGEHFVVLHPRGKDEVLVPYLIDALEKQRAALAEGLGTTPRVKVTVEVVNDVRELAQLSTLTEDEVRTTGTVAVSKFGKLMMLSPKALLKGYDWLDTAAHEFTHYVITERTHNRAPLWMQEGLAKWFEQGWRGRHDPVTPFSAALVRDAVARKNLVTFEEMHPSLAKLPTQERAALAYAEVSMAIEWLVKQKGPGVLPRVTGLLGEGRSTEEAVSQAAGVPFKRFLDDWNRYMAQRPLPRGTDRELKRLGGELADRFKDDPKKGTQFAEWSEIPDEDSRGFARLGEIFRARSRWAAARLEYAKAYEKVGARIPILSGRYALAALMSGDKAGAEKILSEALAWNPDYPALNVQMGRLLLDRGQLQAARDHLLAANRQDPFDSEIHAGLAKILGALDDPGGAERETRFAKILMGQETPP